MLERLFDYKKMTFNVRILHSFVALFEAGKLYFILEVILLFTAVISSTF